MIKEWALYSGGFLQYVRNLDLYMHICTRRWTVVQPLHKCWTNSSQATPGQWPHNFAKPLQKPLLKKKKASGDHSTFFATASMGVHLHKKRRKWPLIAFFSFFLNVRRGNRYLISVLWLLVKLGSLGHLDSRPPPLPFPCHCSTSWMNCLLMSLVHFLLGSLSFDHIFKFVWALKDVYAF